MLGGRRWLAVGMICFGGAAACHGIVPTRTLVDAFNGGMLDSSNDPFYPPEKRAEDVVARRMREELGDGYFGQGRDDARVVLWLRALSTQAMPFMSSALPVDAALASPTEPAPAAKQTVQAAVQSRVKSALDTRAQTFVPVDRPLCRARHDADGEALEAFADYVRFRTALERAVGGAEALLDERLATITEVIHGAERAFGDTAAYLANRRWRRARAHPTTGLVVKGGAATGIFSAGVVWVALNVIDQCVKAGKCSRDDAGFALVSGTSTGATIVGAVDKFQTALADPRRDPHEAIAQYERWYLCSSMNDLYCVRNHTAVNLARGEGAAPADVQDSMLDFVGLAQKIEKDYGCDEMNNRTELVLNAVDFRTGRLYALSDQDRTTLAAPWDATMAIVSSAALPFIVRPVYHLPVDPKVDGNYAYLDGGIRSELPVLALVRRGVERVLVVSSGASITSESAPIHNAAKMAIRYLDVSTGGVTEAELEHAQSRAEAGRLAEHETCIDFLRKHDGDAVRRGEPALCTGVCDREAVCSGDFAAACDREVSPPKTGDNGTPRHAEIIAKTWQMTSVWRDERRVPGLPGYAFEPVEQRRLMLAGAEIARQKCEAIASALGIELSAIDPDPAKARATLFSWCTPTLPTTEEACGKKATEDAKQKKAAPDCANDDGPRPTPGIHSTDKCSAGSR